METTLIIFFLWTMSFLYCTMEPMILPTKTGQLFANFTVTINNVSLGGKISQLWTAATGN